MFSKATANFVRQVDPEGSLIHVSRMNDFSKLLPTALVVKRKRNWFWQRPKYQPTDFKLNDLLLGDEKLTPVVSKKEFLSSFKSSYGNVLTGGLDVEAGSVSVKLEALGSSKLQTDFGKLWKEEVDVTQLLKDSNKRLVDMEHVLVQQLEKRCEILAVVKERILTTADCTVKGTKKEQCAFNAMVEMLRNLGATMKACIKERSELVADEDVSLKFSDVVIAYSILELRIEKDGNFTICPQPGKIGGFEADMVRLGSQDELNVVDARCFDGNISGVQLQENDCQLEDLAPLAELSQSNRWDLFRNLQAVLTDKAALSLLQSKVDVLCFGQTPGTTQEENLSGCVDSSSPSLNAVHLLVTALEALPDETLSLMCDSQPEFLEAFSTLLNLTEESSCPLTLQSLPTLLFEREAFEQAKKLLSSIDVTLDVNNNQLSLKMGNNNEKCQVHLFVLHLSTYGLSLLCSGKK